MNKSYKSFHKYRKPRPYFVAFLIFFAIYGFNQFQEGNNLPPADKDNGGLFLPGGFEAVVVVDSIGGGTGRGQGNNQNNEPARPGVPAGRTPMGNYFGARHMSVNSNGDIYVKLRVHTPDGNGNVALRDVNNDGKADVVNYWGKYVSLSHGTGMRIHKGYVYFSSNLMVLRQKLIPGQLVPDSKIDTIVIDDLQPHSHQTKPIAFDNKGYMYVGWGAGSDICAVQGGGGGVGARGQGKPDAVIPGEGCPLLKDQGGIWMFDENKLKQRLSDGLRYATGLRSTVGIDWDPISNSLYSVMHGRDNFTRPWPELYSPWESAILPADELFKVSKGMDGGWPYYYYDQIQGKKLLNPEYGGDKKKEAPAKIARPVLGFPGHFAPNTILFYKGNQFPARYKNGAFVAFHGSTIRQPYPQAGYFVMFVPMKNGVVSGPWEVFADGFIQTDPVLNANQAGYRPTGLAEGPDGSLYLGETERGKIWRVMFKGNKATFGAANLARMEIRKRTASNIKTPHPILDNVDRGKPVVAAAVYNLYCRACHQANGGGDGSRYPPLAGSEWVTGNKTRLIGVVLNGLQGTIEVKGVHYSEIMPAHGSFMSDEQIAEVLTYIRSNFGNNEGPVTTAEVSAVRKTTAK